MDKKISQLTAAATPLAGTETLPVVQGGSTVKTTVQDVLGYVVNDSTNSVLKTVYSASDVGLKLDFANNIFALGKDDGADINNTFGFVTENLHYAAIGDIGSAQNDTRFVVDDFIQTIYTRNNGTEKGLKLDFVNSTFNLGFPITGGVEARLDIAGNNYYVDLGDYSNTVNGLGFLIDVSNDIIKTYKSTGDKGLNLDFANNVYWIGDVINGNIGFICEAGESKMGDYNGNNNGTVLGVSDSTEQIIASPNLSAPSAGSSSGQFLKIKVGGVDYKIALLNN